MTAMTEEEDGRSAETLLIRALCCGTPQGSVKEEGRRLLRNYHWHDEQCHAVYDALMNLPAQNLEILRELLPSELTRRGFPDVEWEDIFAPHLLSRDEVIGLMRRIDEMP
jgi:hypothetical protein